MHPKSETTPISKSPDAELSPSEKILAGLNPEQKRAVLHGDGPLLIVAGAGTGKTSVLTKRIAYLITSKKALPKEILALTFTDKAAHEMEERVDKLVPYGFNDVWISAFHSFGDRILREYAFEIGLSPDLRVMTMPEAVVFVRQNLFKFKLDHYRPLAEPARFIESLLTTFSRAKDEEVSPAEFLAYAKKFESAAETNDEKEEAKKMMEVANAYHTYEELKTAAGFIDFGDQVILCLKILREHPAVLKRVQDRFKYVLVDEFQDTNFAQFELLKLLAAPHKNITVVGDDDQSIYKFRGACLSNILGFRKTYSTSLIKNDKGQSPEADAQGGTNIEQVVLLDNYRSTQEVLDAAYKLIQNNNPDRLEAQDHLNKFLRSQKGSGQAVRFTLFDTLYSETEFVAQEIKRKIDTEQRVPKDFAILVRTNASAEPFMKSLNLLSVPWQFSGNAGLYQQEEVQLALSFLRILDQPEDSASLYFLAVSPIYDLDPDDSAILTEISGRTRRPLLEIFKNDGDVSAGAAISDETKTKVARIVADIKKYRAQSTKIPTGNLLYNFFEESGVLKKLAESEDLKSLQQAQNLHRFFDIIKKFGQVCLYDRVHYFIEYVESLRLAGDDPSSAENVAEENAVNIMTVHAAKGLEFPIVYMAGLEEGHFPLTDRGEKIELPEALIKDILPQGDYHKQEERRLFYVGLTRAKDELFLAAARDHGKKKVWKVSLFVTEALDKPQVDEVAIKSSPLDSLKIFSRAAAPALRNPESQSTARGSDLYLSPTGLEEYLDCPLKYRFSHILKIPVLVHHTAIFGIAVHEALKAYHLFRKVKEPMNLDKLLEIFKNAWKSVGFISREHEEKRFQEGIKLLKSYYKKEEKSQIIPSLVEEDFRMTISNAKIRGRWDRVDMTDHESVIIDYKTGDVKDQKDADKKAKESIQLGLYAIAFQSRFGKLPDRTALYFIKHGLEGSITPTAERIAKVTEQTQKVITGISHKEFFPTPGYHCRWCPYEKICPAVK